MNRRFLLTTAAAALMTGGMFTSAFAQDAASTDAPVVEDLVLGSADATVEILEYGSFTCPHCATFHEAFYKPLKAEYIDTGKVRFVYRELVRNRFDIWASMLARCGDGIRYEGISGMLFEQQTEWTAGGDPATMSANLRQMGKIVGFNDEQLDQCFSDASLAEAILNKSTTEAEADNVTGTPTVFINGERVSLSTYEAFKAEIDAALGE